MTSSGLWSGSISDIILRTAVVVSSPVARSDKPEKIRLMKCRKNLKSSRDLKSVFINEDLTHTRNKIFFLARQLQKNKSVEQVWTTNGNIRLKDSHGQIYETNTIDRFLQVAVQLGK
jgi:5-bromo-4-chloroindolyl phosphate hydrolysis protein